MGQNSISGYYALQQYLQIGGDLDKRLYAALDGYTWAHTNGYSLDSYKLNDAIDLGEGYYVCNVTTETTSLTSGNGEQHDVNNLKLLVLDSGNDIRVISLI